jgi:hypothetical protein
MSAVRTESPLELFWSTLAFSQQGVLILNLELLLTQGIDNKPLKPLRTFAPVTSALGRLLRTTKTKVAILSERHESECSWFLPDPWPDELARNGNGRSHSGTIELHAGVRNKVEIVRKLTAESTGLPLAFLGTEPSDEPAFHALGGSGLAVLVRSELRLTAAQALIRPPEELLNFLDRWFQSCKGLGAAC